MHIETKALKPDPYYIHPYVNLPLCAKLYKSVNIWPDRFSYP